ncbi:MAG TPA: GNAT family N-acetyltransferase [Pyrinomonadaceae bacterium]|jgi:GNAT superfamily N-acetyltransferase
MEAVNDILCSPRNHDDWSAYHTIRRKVLFENRGEFGVYIENHPDEFESGHHPLVLVHTDATIGVIRVDVEDRVAWFRRVAIREDQQGRGHGRCLLRLAEAFARRQGCHEVRSNVAADAVGFYERCGYAHDIAEAEPGSVPMRKALA